MRVLLDTNVVVSGLLFGGEPRSLLRTLCSSPFELWTSRPLLWELAAVLSSRRLQAPLGRTGLTVEDLVRGYAGQTFVVPDEALHPEVFPPDPSDAAVVAAAKAAVVAWVITGDRHLLDAQEAMPFEVLTVAVALGRAGEVRTG